MSDLQNDLDDLLNAKGINVSYKNLLDQVYRDEKDYTVSLNQFKMDYDKSRNLQLLDYFNPVQFELTKPNHQSNILAVIFWIIVSLVFMSIMGCICKLCPCLCPLFSTGLLKCNNYGFTFLRLLCGRMCQRRTDAENAINDTLDVAFEASPSNNPQEGSPLVTFTRQLPDVPYKTVYKRVYPGLEEFYEKENPIIKWIITESKEKEKIIVAYVPNHQGQKMKVFYDHLEDKVTDRNGVELRFIKKPDPNFVKLFRNQVARSDPPAWFRDYDKVIKLHANPDIHFNETLKIWKNTDTGRILGGMPHPKIDDVVYEMDD
jgi:hypothetical protein